MQAGGATDLSRAVAVHASNRCGSAYAPLAGVCGVLLDNLEATLPLALLCSFCSLGSAGL